MATSETYATSFDEDDGKTINATCPECPGQIEVDGGERSCAECGLIVDEYYLDHAGKPRTFEGETDRERTGAPLTPSRHDRGLSSEIGFGGDARGNALSAKKRRQVARLRRLHNQARWRTKQERNLSHACSEIARLVSALDLPSSVKDEASLLFRKAQREDLIRGRSLETITAGCIYAACRRGGFVRTVEDIAGVATVINSEVSMGYRLVALKLGLKIPIIGPRAFISRIATECDVPTHVQYRAHELAAIAVEGGIANGRNPAGVAAACLYVAGQELGVENTQAELATVANVTESTLRKRYYELRDELD